MSSGREDGGAEACEVSFHTAYALGELLGVSMPWETAMAASALVRRTIRCVLGSADGVAAHLTSGESFSGKDAEAVAAQLAAWIARKGRGGQERGGGVEALCAGLEALGV